MSVSRKLLVRNPIKKTVPACLVKRLNHFSDFRIEGIRISKPHLKSQTSGPSKLGKKRYGGIGQS
jgi:hypothetical protein